MISMLQISMFADTTKYSMWSPDGIEKFPELVEL